MTYTSAPATPGATPEPEARSRLRGVRLAALRDYGVLFFLIALFIALSVSTDTFLTENNLKNVLDGAVPLGLLAVAGAFVIMAGGFDFSAGSILAVAAIVGAQVSNDTSPTVGIILAVALGAGLGLFNALMCTVGRINPFIGTLATFIGFAGLAVVLSDSTQVLVSDASFANFANTDILGFSSATWIFVAVAALFAFLLNRTVFGQHVLGTGGNPAAARLSGVRTNRTLAITFVLSGATAALAGAIVTARALTVSANVGSTLIFDAIAAILIGGISFWGGEGAIWRVLVGVAILSLISNGFNLLGVDPVYQQIVSGGLILVAIAADQWTRRS